MSSPDSPNTPPIFPEDKDNANMLYQIVAGRRGNYDSMAWQTPALSLTAQAFLLTIALGGGTSRCSRIISALLAIVATIASIQLMIRHRYFEQSDSEWLQQYEKIKLGSVPVHGSQRPFGKEVMAKMRGPTRWFAGRSSLKWWLGTLLLFFVGSLTALVMAIFWPTLLDP